MPVSTVDIERYYDTQQVFYTHLWSRSALHYGLWYPETKTLREAIKNTDRLMTHLLDIRRDDIVLDAGCGVGGSCFHIAESTRAHVEGITLSGVQLAIARRSCKQLGLETRVNFSRQDFCQTDFKDMSFSKVFGIEAISHALQKADFVAEAYRLLMYGGRLGVCDAFLARDDPAIAEDLTYKRFLQGWALPNLVSRTSFTTLLRGAGFKEIVFHDLSDLIARSINRIYLHGLWTHPFSVLKALLGAARRDYPARNQKSLDRK